MTTTIDALVEALEAALDFETEYPWANRAKAALARARAEQAAPSKYATLDNLKNWSLLAARALDDCHRVIETIEAESTEEENSLTELDARVYNLFNQALVMNGLLTRTQLDKATPFNRIELSATPPAAPAKLEPLDKEHLFAAWAASPHVHGSSSFPEFMGHYDVLLATHNAKLGGGG